jgi:hypothetical protein
MNAREMRKTILAGHAAGWKWAEDGRSIAAVEAVTKWLATDQEDSTLFDAMVKEIGDDDEFASLKNKDRSYRQAWYGGVCEVFEKWNNKETK